MTKSRNIRRTAVRAATSGLAALSFALISAPAAHAGPSEDECAIWLCMPVGFSVPGCGDAFSAMKDRLKDLDPPLPSLSACTNGRNSGSFETGYEKFEPCQSGFIARDIYYGDDDNLVSRVVYGQNVPDARMCVRPGCDMDDFREDYRRTNRSLNSRSCSGSYRATERAQPWWVEMEIDGQPLEDGKRYYYHRR